MSKNRLKHIDRPELLVPLSGWKSLYKKGKVLQNGDAFYFGLKSNFSMRARANNFETKDVGKLSKLIHKREKKLYLCTNIVIYNNELEELKKIIRVAKDNEIDAIICHDLASIEIAKKIGIPFHISTQANISNYVSAQFYNKLGAERLILSRELNLKQIKEILEKTNIEIEVFIHGAMCTAISGRCYFSSEIMGHDVEFSANRGRCVQPCRRYYRLVGEESEEIEFVRGKEGLFFNAKDLCMIEHIEELMITGIHAFKIEGRMRDPLYIAETASCYREAIDSVLNKTYSQKKIRLWLNRLENVFNRGFHTGYYFSRPHLNDIQFTQRGNVSKKTKQYVGKVTNYYRKSQAVEIDMHSGQISLGDRLIFENKGDFFHEMVIKSMQVNDSSIKITENASSDNHIVVGIKVEQRIPKNAMVSVLIENN
ncbi:MAG: U32 family peptidase [Candidatus Lokiarchaeota archaeon]|nr:U32 family peptidase [Candidatus Lokiarchaeota archaeon]